jgi:hypothetical protein
MKRILPTLILATTLATTAVATPASAAQKTGVREVCAKSTYLTLQPGKNFTGTLTKHQTIRVTRYSPSGKYAYGFARGHINRKGWVKTSALCK